MKKKILMIISVPIVVIITLIAVHIYETYFYSFHGKVIDADTKQPIEGMVVVASWNEVTFSIAEGGTRFKNVKEVLTDKNGEWRIHGPKGNEGGTLLNILKRLIPLLTSFCCERLFSC